MNKENAAKLETLDPDAVAQVSGGYYSFSVNGPGYSMSYGDGPRHWGYGPGYGHRHAYRAYRRMMRHYYYGGW